MSLSQSPPKAPPPPAPAAAAGKSALELVRERLDGLAEKHKVTAAKINAAIKEREVQLCGLLVKFSIHVVLI